MALTCLTCAVLLFTVIRIAYWQTVDELPFSDMADFDRIAHRVAQSFDFSHSEFYRTYKPPVLPLLRAGQILLFGDGMLPWRIVLFCLSLCGLTWLIAELSRVRGGFWLGIGMVAVSAFSKPAVFWSLKLSTEGVAEALLYFAVAAALWSLRRQSFFALFSVGVLLTIALFNRPNFAPCLPLFGLWFWRYRDVARVSQLGVERRRSTWVLALAFMLGVSVVWTPWLLRSYSIYGHVVPLNTSGALSFIYGVWEVDTEDVDGVVRPHTYQTIMEQAEQRFANDYELSTWANGVVLKWLRANWRSFIKELPGRVMRIIRSSHVGLTRVPRDRLFPGGVNSLLFDKSTFVVFSGMAGLMLLPLLFVSELSILALFSIPYFLFSVVFQANPRFLEPIITFFVFGNIAWFVLLDRAVPKPTLSPGWSSSLRIGACFCVVCLSLVVGSSFLRASTQVPIVDTKDVGLANPGFELPVTEEGRIPYWTVGGDSGGEVAVVTAPVVSGNQSVQLSNPNGVSALYQDIVLHGKLAKAKGLRYTLSAKIKLEGEGSSYLALTDSVQWYYSRRVFASSEWQIVSIAGVLPEEFSSLRVHIYVDHGQVALDDVQLRLDD